MSVDIAVKNFTIFAICSPIAIIKLRILTTAIDVDDGTASLDLAMSVADCFEPEKDNAKVIAAPLCC